jgi:hypothetical protein
MAEKSQKAPAFTLLHYQFRKIIVQKIRQNSARRTIREDRASINLLA